VTITELRQKIVIALGDKVMTSHAIAKAIGVEKDAVVKALSRQRGWPHHLELYQWRDNIGQRHYQLVPPNDEPRLARDLPQKAFRYLRAKHPTPYIRIFIPDDITDVNGEQAEHIELVPFSDVHWGHRQCDAGAFTMDVKEVERRPNRFCIYNGDNIENALGDSAKGVAYAEQRVNAKVQRHQLVEVIRPIAHKSLAATPGNHENRSSMKTLLNPLEEVAREIGTPYFNGPYNMEIVWRGCRWTFHVMHGNGNSATKGGKQSAAGRPRTFNDVRHFFISGHVHHQTTGKQVRIVRRRVHDQDSGELLRFWYENVKEYVVICPAYLDYDDTYAYEWGLPPGSRNKVTFQLFRNGDYHVLASKRSSGKDGYKTYEERIVEDAVADDVFDGREH